MEVIPEVLVFTPPFLEEEVRPLLLKNHSKHRQAFKVKTTVPSLYCVRPNCAVLDANHSVELQIIRQPFSSEPVEGQKYKDKFQVQSFPIPDDYAIDEQASISETWSTLEGALTKQMQAIKIKVQYDFSKKSNGTSAGTTTAHPDGVAPVTTAGTGATGAAAASATGAAGATAAAQKSFDHSVNDVSVYDDVSNGSVPKETAVGAGTAAAASGVSSGDGAIRQRIPNDAQTEIASTNQKIADMNRDMKTAPAKETSFDNELTTTKTKLPSSAQSSSAAVPAVKSPASFAVPLPFVAILFLLAFIIGWKIF